MKKLSLALMTSCLVVTACQTAKVPKKQPLVLDSFDQKVSYFQGYNAVKTFQKNNIALDEAVFAQAVHDALTGVPAQFPEDQWPELKEQITKVLKDNQEKEHKQQIEANHAAERIFLADNSKKEGVHITDTGLQYKILRPADGAKPKEKDIVTVNYVGKLVDGSEFESSEKKDHHPVEFDLEHLIPGLREGLQLMSVGSKWEFYIPSYLAYGDGPTAKIPSGSMLIFTIELLATKPKVIEKPKIK